MSVKKWLANMLLCTLFICLALMGLNYYVDRNGYFGALKGTVNYSEGDNHNQRIIKTMYARRNAEKYNAVILGGSKAGALEPSVLNDYTGLSFYNAYCQLGNFRDYVSYLEYYVEQMELQAVVLHISSIEVSYYEPLEAGYDRELPAVVTGESQLKEMFTYLLVDPINMAKSLKEKILGINVSDSDALDGQSNLESRYTEEYKEDCHKNVLYNYEGKVKQLCTSSERDVSASDLNIDALKKIKSICDENGIELKVVIGASFISELADYECEEYYSYLKEMVNVTEIYDFGGYYDVNRNPYNFYNPKHYYREVGNEMLQFVYSGEQESNFGTLLTKDNIDEYIEQRRKDYESVKREYEQTGTIELYGKEHESNLCK